MRELERPLLTEAGPSWWVEEIFMDVDGQAVPSRSKADQVVMVWYGEDKRRLGETHAIVAPSVYPETGLRPEEVYPPVDDDYRAILAELARRTSTLSQNEER